MSKGTIPSIAFNRMRNDVHRLIALPYITPELREYTKKFLPLLDLMEKKFVAEYYGYASAPPKLSDVQRRRLNDTRDKAIREAQFAVQDNKPVTENPYPAGDLHDLWRKAWRFFAGGAPGGYAAFKDYDPPAT